MFFYEVGYISYDTAPKYMLLSNNEYTQEEFDILVADCFSEAFFIMMNEELSNGNQYDIDYCVDELIDSTIKVLIDKHNFIEPVIKCNFRPNGWSSIKNNNSRNRNPNNQTILIRERFKIYSRNNNIKKLLD